MSAREARRLRTEEQLSIAQIQHRLGVSKHTLTDWLRGVPAPGWTLRPNAKDDLRSRATELRGQGWSVNDIALELGVARSTAWQWVKHLPLDRDSDRAKAKQAHAKLMTDARWAAHRVARDSRRELIRAAATTDVGDLSIRDLMLVGAAVYWCEGKKAKPWRADGEYLTFTNTDPRLLQLFLRFLGALGVSPGELSYRVAIHESADATEAVRWWCARLSLPVGRFQRPTLKRHKPQTNRHNTGDDYHGCLVIRVPRSREIYWRVEGLIDAMAD
jgi:transcriptional regulator with XRE-family HTH domain